MFTCFIDNLLTFVFALMIICSHVYLLWWSHASMLTCFYVHVFQLSYAPMSTCFDDHMPTFFYAFIVLHLDALLITCSYVQMLSWLHAHMHWYSQVWYPHTSVHTLMMKCLLAWRLKWSCSRTFVHLNVLMIVLKCWGDLGNWDMCTWVLKC